MFFTGIGKFSRDAIQVPIKGKCKNPPDMHQGKCLYICKMPFTVKIRNLEKLGILKETKNVTEWVNSFVIMEKKTPDVSSSQQDRKL